MVSPFDDTRLYRARSALLKITPDDQGRFEFNLGCQYTRYGLNQLQVGDLIAVENYTTTDNEHEKTYSVLTLTQVLPVHFAAEGLGAYPGHVFESMRSIKEDWENQKDNPLQATTTISCKAVSTGWQFSFNDLSDDLPPLEEERSLPMVGAEIRPLSRDMVNAIINYQMDAQPESHLTHKKFDTVNVKLNNRALLTTHFGIFGFTGVGKSNFVSSLVDSIIPLSLAEETDETEIEENADEQSNFVNIVIIDPNDEYLGLFIDKFVHEPECLRYIHVGADSLPRSILVNLHQERTNPTDDNIDLLRRQIHLPSDLREKSEIQEYIRIGIRNALTRTAIAFPERDLSRFVRAELRRQMPNQISRAGEEALREIEGNWANGVANLPFTVANVQHAIDLERNFGSSIRTPIQRVPQNNRGTVEGVIERTLRSLERLRDSMAEVPIDAVISFEDLIRELNSCDRSRIVIITGRRDLFLKEFCSILGNELYESRRLGATGLDIEPFTVLLLDEADLFIPSDVDDEITKRIKETCITIARRGRKFNLGIGISTQRASMLDTQVMGNLHTYFVSKLPRKYDRDKVAEAFGIGEEELSPTFTFRPGNWLVISHDATGLKGVPIPAAAYNANERIIRAAIEHDRDNGS